MGSGTGSETRNVGQAQPTEDVISNRWIHLESEIDAGETVSMFPCDIRESLTQAMNLYERGFRDVRVKFPNGRKLKAAQVVRMFGLGKYTAGESAS